MRRGLVLLCAICALSFFGCSKSGQGGSGSPEDLEYEGMGEGNIPTAKPGSELADVNFGFDSSELNSSAQSTLRQNADWLKKNSGTRVVVEGHCDERGTPEYNMALGERRASSVKSYLRSLGVASDNMSTVSYGEELPLDTGHTESAWSQNRRAHFSV